MIDSSVKDKSIKLPDGIVHSISYIINIIIIEPSHYHPSSKWHIDMIMIVQILNLRFGHPSIGKHTNLICNMIPRTWCFYLL